MTNQKPETPAKEEVQNQKPEAPAKVKAVSCRCVVKCHHEGLLYRIGDTLVTAGAVPNYFEKID